MKKFKPAAAAWCIVSAVLLLCAAAAIRLGLSGRTAMLVDVSVLTEPSRQVLECARSGDFGTLGSLLHGAPRLGAPCGDGSGPEDLLWNAYLQSICWSFPGTYSQAGEALELDAQIECLDLAAVLERMDELAVASGDSREAALCAAAAKVLAEEPPTMRRNMKLQLVRGEGAWQVVPTPALQQLLSGFVTE